MLRINAAALKSRGIRVSVREGGREIPHMDDVTVEVYVSEGRQLNESVIIAIRETLTDPGYQDAVLGMLHQKIAVFQILEAIAETSDR
jgi:hypothetical protein